MKLLLRIYRSPYLERRPRNVKARQRVRVQRVPDFDPTRWWIGPPGAGAQMQNAHEDTFIAAEDPSQLRLG